MVQSKRRKGRSQDPHSNSRFGKSCACWIESIPENTPIVDFLEMMREVIRLDDRLKGGKNVKK